MTPKHSQLKNFNKLNKNAICKYTIVGKWYNINSNRTFGWLYIRTLYIRHSLHLLFPWLFLSKLINNIGNIRYLCLSVVVFTTFFKEM